MAYTTSQIDTIIAQLESGLAKGYASVSHQGETLSYRSVAEIRSAIVYFQSLYDQATDAPTTANGTPPRKIRTYFGYGGKGIGQI